MNNNKGAMLNVFCSLIMLATNTIISFWLSPFIVSHIGVEANGFVTLANNFIAYASVIVTALNSMAARFITISYVNRDYKKANLYYNSVFWGNLLIVAALFIPAVYFVLNINSIFIVPVDILGDVQILFTFVFLSFFLGTAFPNWECGTYITNRLDRDYAPQTIVAIIRCLLLFLTMTIFKPRVWYIGAVACIVTVLLLFVRGYNTHKLTQFLRISIRPGKWICSISAIKELVGAGIWNSISCVGNMLLDGLDLVICNIYLGPVEMGIVSLSKILPLFIQQLSASIRTAFAPSLTINFAKGDTKLLVNELNKAMKITSIIMIIPIAGIITYGEEFFCLWVPSQNAKLLQVLTIMSILGYTFTSGTQILYNVYGVVNKVKQNALSMVLSGTISLLITLLLLRFTSAGIYAIVGVSTIVNLIRNICFTIPVATRYLGYKWNYFYSQVYLSVVSTLLLVILGLIFKWVYVPNTWFGITVSASAYAIVALGGVFFVIFNKSERQYLLDLISSKYMNMLKK